MQQQSTQSPFVAGTLANAGTPNLDRPSAVAPGAERKINFQEGTPPSSAAAPVIPTAIDGADLGSHSERGNRAIDSRGTRLR